ncbi:MAG: cation:proton antiporter, partial [Polyangiales bacterium]
MHPWPCPRRLSSTLLGACRARRACCLDPRDAASAQPIDATAPRDVAAEVSVDAPAPTRLWTNTPVDVISSVDVTAVDVTPVEASVAAPEPPPPPPPRPAPRPAAVDAGPPPVDVAETPDVDVVDDAGQGSVAEPVHLFDHDAGPPARADAGAVSEAPSPHDAPLPVWAIARVTLGLMLIFGLALLAGMPAVRAWERRSGIAMVTGSGLPFLVLGLVARRPEVGILSESVVRDLRPLLEFGLGWIGFRVGTDFDLRQVDRWPKGTARAMAIESACTTVVVGVISAAVLYLVKPEGTPDENVVRNAVIIGACAAVSAPTGARLLASVGLMDRAAARHLRRVASLDDVMALLAVAVVTAAFRPIDGSTWQLPPLGWVFLQMGMGVGLGSLVWAAVRSAKSASEDVAMTLGALAFAAGMAGYVGFSPLVVCFVAGMTVANVPGATSAGSWLSRPRFRDLERPIYMAFFVVVGALWAPHDARGWIMLPVYVLARLGGKLLGVRAASRALAESAGGAAKPGLRLGTLTATWMSLFPSSAVSIAVVVSARQSYPEALRGGLETMVIGGAILSELVFRVSVRALAGSAGAATDAPVGALAISHDDLPVDDDRLNGDATGSTPPSI